MYVELPTDKDIELTESNDRAKIRNKFLKKSGTISKKEISHKENSIDSNTIFGINSSKIKKSLMKRSKTIDQRSKSVKFTKTPEIVEIQSFKNIKSAYKYDKFEDKDGNNSQKQLKNSNSHKNSKTVKCCVCLIS